VRRRHLVAIALLAVAVSSAAAAPPPLEESCLRPAERARTVRFRTADGTRLAGVLLGKGQKGVVLAHQLGGDLCQWLPFARVLGSAGFRALAFDFRGYGSSARVTPNVRLDRDVAGAAAELRRRGVRSVFLMGASMGGTAVLGAAPAIRPRVAGVVDLSGPVSIGGVDALAAVRRLTSPALFVAARFDRSFADSTRLLYRAAASREKRLMITGGTEHGVDLLVIPAVRRRVLMFLG
jgi:pimeloyl-ACP methyl ester carboxylesterase